MARHRKGSAHRPQPAVQAKLTHEHSAFECSNLQLSRCNEDPDRDGQIKRSPVLAHIGWCKVHSDPAGRNLETGIDERRADSLAALFDGARCESDDRPLRQASGRIHFDDDVEGINSQERGGTHS